MKPISRIVRIARWLVLAVAVLLAAGGTYQFLATRSGEKRYPPHGTIIAVGGRTFHLNCTGSGSPTVVLEAGLNGGSLDWALVQPEVAKFARVCSYDRSGFAWSGANESGGHDAISANDDLHSLLNAAAIAPPYVMVGHSIGGIYIQSFSAKYAREVAGVVLVDSSHPDQLSRIPGIPSFVPYVLTTAAPFGVVRIVNQMDSPPNFSPDLAAERAALYSRTGSIWTVAHEISEVPSSFAQVRAVPMQLGDKPLIVLARGLSDGLSPNGSVAWRELQSDLARASSRGSLVIAEKSGHYIQFSEPGLVIEAIRQVTQAYSVAHKLSWEPRLRTVTATLQF